MKFLSIFVLAVLIVGTIADSGNALLTQSIKKLMTSVKNATSETAAALTILGTQNNNVIVNLIENSSDPIPLIKTYLKQIKPTYSAVFTKAENEVGDTLNNIAASLKATSGFGKLDVDAAIDLIQELFILAKAVFNVNKDLAFSRAEKQYVAIGAQIKPGSGYTRAKIVQELETTTEKQATDLLKAIKNISTVGLSSVSTALQSL